MIDFSFVFSLPGNVVQNIERFETRLSSDLVIENRSANAENIVLAMKYG